MKIRYHCSIHIICSINPARETMAHVTGANLSFKQKQPLSVRTRVPLRCSDLSCEKDSVSLVYGKIKLPFCHEHAGKYIARHPVQDTGVYSPDNCSFPSCYRDRVGQSGDRPYCKEHETIYKNGHPSCGGSAGSCTTRCSIHMMTCIARGCVRRIPFWALRCCELDLCKEHRGFPIRRFGPNEHYHGLGDEDGDDEDHENDERDDEDREDSFIY